MRYHDITKDDMKNGSGLRVVLWVSGCEHCCPGCHNPITWDINDGLVFDEQAKQEIFEELGKDYISGITFSGGDPLHTQNRAEVEELMKEIKQKFPKKTIWLYTGYNYDNILSLNMMKYIDVLVDGRYDEELRDTKLHWRGSANQRVIDMIKTRQEGKVVLYCG